MASAFLRAIAQLMEQEEKTPKPAVETAHVPPATEGPPAPPTSPHPSYVEEQDAIRITTGYVFVLLSSTRSRVNNVFKAASL